MKRFLSSVYFAIGSFISVAQSIIAIPTNALRHSDQLFRIETPYSTLESKN